MRAPCLDQVGDADAERDQRDRPDQPVRMFQAQQPHQAVGAVAFGTAAALGETVQAAHQQAQGEQREQQIHHTAADQPRAYQQALGIAAVPVGIADALCQAPSHMG